MYIIHNSTNLVSFSLNRLFTIIFSTRYMIDLQGTDDFSNRHPRTTFSSHLLFSSPEEDFSFASVFSCFAAASFISRSSFVGRASMIGRRFAVSSFTCKHECHQCVQNTNVTSVCSKQKFHKCIQNTDVTSMTQIKFTTYKNLTIVYIIILQI